VPADRMAWRRRWRAAAREVESGPRGFPLARLGPRPGRGRSPMEFVQTAKRRRPSAVYRFTPGVHLMVVRPVSRSRPVDLLAPPEPARAGGRGDGRQWRASRCGPGRGLLFLDDRGDHARRRRRPTCRGPGSNPLGGRRDAAPIGDPYIVTEADGKPDRRVGRAAAAGAAAGPGRGAASPGAGNYSPAGVHLGIVIDEYQTEPGQGDFLVRGIAGADPESGTIAVGGELEVGQTVAVPRQGRPFGR